MHIKGYDCFLTAIDLANNVAEPTSIWPDYWVEQYGGRQTRAPDAPSYSYILPVSATDSAGAAVAFDLRTTVASNFAGQPAEVVNPNILLPAFVNRWLSVPYRVGADLWMYNNAAALAPTQVVLWYFYKQDDDCLPVELKGPQGPGFMTG